ncbi:hypothetical protein OROMI_002554 [Orobanche minor]
MAPPRFKVNEGPKVIEKLNPRVYAMMQVEDDSKDGADTMSEKDGPFIFMKDNTTEGVAAGEPEKIPNRRNEMSSEERKLANLDNRARDILYQTMDKATMLKIKNCNNAKEVWDTLAVMCEGTELIKENKLSIATQKFDNFKINSLGKTYGNMEMALKVLRSLNPKGSVKAVAMRESKDLNKIKIHELFRNNIIIS